MARERSLCQSVGADRIISFGNDHNDISMFEVSDEAYVMAGSRPAVIAAATAVIGGNDTESVARWLAGAMQTRTA